MMMAKEKNKTLLAIKSIFLPDEDRNIINESHDRPDKLPERHR
jgi:hypothetical protein